MILAASRTDLALASVTAFAHSSAIDRYADSAGQGNQVRRLAVVDLSQFPQPRALHELRGFLGDPDYFVQFAAVEALSVRKDPQALEFLLKLAGTRKKSYRGESFNLLAQDYPEDPRVRPVLEKAMKDRDDLIRFQAKEALEQLDRRH
jgi:HEAT repeat protein